MLDVLSKQIIDLYYTDYQFFFSKPNVVGIAYGEKIINGVVTCEPSIHVFVEKKLAANCLTKQGVIPSLYKGVKTDVIETGKFIASMDSELTNKCRTTMSPDYTKRVRPIQPGYGMSTFYGIYNFAGTLGYIVLDNEQISKTYCLLSVNKTFADYNQGSIGGEIIQPARIYGGHGPEDIVAQLLRYQPLIFRNAGEPPPPISEYNVIDASIASIYNVGEVQLINPFIPPNNVIPRGIGSPDIGKFVEWTACGAGHRTGSITSIKGIIKVVYLSNIVCWFKDIIVTTGFAQPSDEGALIYDKDRNAIGILFGFSPKHRNLVCSINLIQDMLKVTLLTE